MGKKMEKKDPLSLTQTIIVNYLLFLVVLSGLQAEKLSYHVGIDQAFSWIIFFSFPNPTHRTFICLDQVYPRTGYTNPFIFFLFLFPFLSFYFLPTSSFLPAKKSNKFQPFCKEILQQINNLCFISRIICRSEQGQESACTICAFSSLPTNFEKLFIGF